MEYKKIYGANYSGLSVVINVNGKPTRIEFTGGVPFGASRVSARYMTTNRVVQEAIESDPRYGELFFLEVISPIEKQERIEKKGKVREYNYITRMQDAINILVTNHGVSLDDMRNKDEVKMMAKKNNVSFPNMR